MCVARSRTLFLLKFSLRDDDDEFLYGDSQLKAPAVAAPVPSSAGENTSSPPRNLYPPATRFVSYSSPKRNINSTFWLTFFSLRVPQPQPQPQPRPQSQLNRKMMSEFASATVNRAARTHLTTFFPFSFLAFRLARRQCQLTTTYSRLSVLLWT